MSLKRIGIDQKTTIEIIVYEIFISLITLACNYTNTEVHSKTTKQLKRYKIFANELQPYIYDTLF